MADVELLRESPVAFAAEAIDAPLTAAQASIFEPNREQRRHREQILAILAPRQTGKSLFLAKIALWRAFREPGHRVLIVSASEDAARRLLAEVRRFAAHSPLLAGSVVDEQAGLVRLSNGSEIRSVPASERQIRGWPVGTLLVDEAALVPDDLLLGAAFPTVAAAPDAWIVVASSALRAAGAFYDLVQQGRAGSEHVRTVEGTLRDAPWITASNEAMLRASMSPTRAAAELDNEFAEGTGLLFTRASIDRVIADFPLWRWRDLVPPGRLLVGLDPAATGADRFGRVALGRNPLGNQLVVVCAEGLNETRPHVVMDEVAKTRAHVAGFTIDNAGLSIPVNQVFTQQWAQRPRESGSTPRSGVVVVDVASIDPWAMPRPRSAWPEPERPKPFTTKIWLAPMTSEMQSVMFADLRMAIEREQILIPRAADDLVRELLTLRVDLLPSGAERIEAHRGHDDLADAMALSLGVFRDGRRWRTAFNQLFDPRREPIAPALLEGQVETVTTPGGIAVPAVPLFQSVNGPQLTTPPHWKPRRPAKRLGNYVINVPQEA
jgi:hypothetical protein